MLPDGYPPLDVYAQIATERTYGDMMNFSDEFLRNNAAALEYYGRKWVADPLHTWSRRWEYVFAYERLKGMADRLDFLRVLDVGSGLTFFPHFVVGRHPNISIECCDYDRQIHADAGKLVAPASPVISYSVQDISALTYPDQSFDVIYCISVLEHCDNYSEIIESLSHILKPDGRLIVTIDISLDGRSELTCENAARLIEYFLRSFVPDSDYARKVKKCDESAILTTTYALKENPSLLPWKPPRLHKSLGRFLRHGGVRNAPFDYLSCFCMGWTLRNQSANGPHGRAASEARRA